MRTQIVMGSNSKDGKLSLFLLNRHIISTDGAGWTKLEGMVMVDDISSHILVEVECILHFKSIIGVTHDKVIYTEMKQLHPTDCNNRKKFDFDFDFGTKALPPSFLFDPSEWQSGQLFGVTWSLFAHAGIILSPGPPSRMNLKIETSTNTPFQVGYRYTNRLTRLAPDIGQIVSSSGKRFHLFTRNADVNLKGRLINPIIDQNDKMLHIQLEFSNYSASHYIQTVRITLKQKIIIQLHSTQQFKFKKTLILFDETPALSYDINTIERMYTFDLLVQDAFKKLNTAQFARTYPLNWKVEDGVLAGELAPSTLFQEMVPGIIGISCEYSLDIRTLVIEMTSGISSENNITLPVVFGNSNQDLPTPTQTDDPNILLLTRDAFLPILGRLIDDIQNSKDGLETLLVEWRAFRFESVKNDKMVTASSDHAQILLDIVESFEMQLTLFTENILNKNQSSKIPWPNNCIPFNMFLLELELLTRACPSAPAYSASFSGRSTVGELLSASKAYIEYAHQIVLSWIHPFKGDAQKLVDSMRREFHKMRVELEFIAGGGDKDTGQEKIDAEAFHIMAATSSRY